MPRFSDDDVLDFKVTEAVIAHAIEEINDQQEKTGTKKTIDEWKKDPAFRTAGA